MTYKEPAEGIMKNSGFSEVNPSYTIQCNCTDPEHGHTLFVEDTYDFVGVSVILTPTANNMTWKERFKALFTGRAKTDTELLLTVDQARNYSELLARVANEIEIKKVYKGS